MWEKVQHLNFVKQNNSSMGCLNSLVTFLWCEIMGIEIDIPNLCTELRKIGVIVAVLILQAKRAKGTA